MSQTEAFKDLTATTLLLWELVNKQANDEGLWFEAKTAPEAYLQQELRKLHVVIERQAVAFARP